MRHPIGAQTGAARAARGFSFFSCCGRAPAPKTGSLNDTDANRAGQAYAGTVKGSATLSWTPPSKNTDGSRLTDLAGYKIYYGTSKAYLQRVIVVDDPNATGYTIKDLPPFTYYLCVTSYNRIGAESDRSNMEIKTIK